MGRRKLPEESGDKRQQTIVNLTPLAERAFLAAIAKGGKGTKKKLLSLIVNWFFEAPATVQQAIRDEIPPGMEQHYLDAICGYFSELLGVSVEVEDVTPAKLPEAPVTAPSRQSKV